MATTTPNFGWVVPTSTDLVKDGATAIETLGDSIDASLVDLKGGTTGQVLAKNSATDMDFVWTAATSGDITGVTAGVGITGGGTSGDVTVTNSMATAITTNGDLIYGTGSGTFTRLGVGSTGQVLSVASGVPSWATATAATPSYVLINTGGTTLSGSATTTISGLSGYNSYLIMIVGAVVGGSGSATNRFQLNGDTGANYYSAGLAIQSTSASAGYPYNQEDVAANFLPWAVGNTTSSTLSASISIFGAGGSGKKILDVQGSGAAGTNSRAYSYGGYYNGSSVISSFTILNNGAANYTAGTVYIYGSVA